VFPFSDQSFCLNTNDSSYGYLRMQCRGKCRNYDSGRKSRGQKMSNERFHNLDKSPHIMIYLLTIIWLTPGTVHIYTQTIHRTTQHNRRCTTKQLTNWEECGQCPFFTSYTLAFALQLRKKHGKTSVRVWDGEIGLATRYRLSGSKFEPRWGKKSFPLSYR